MNGKDEVPYLPCTDTSDCVELSYASGLFLKPIARISITVTLPHLRAGQAISNKEVIEKLRSAIKPEFFTSIKVSKSNLEFLRLDAEIDHRKKLDFVIKKIDAKGIKLGGFSEVLKIRASEAKIPYPSRHDWDSYFRDTKHMNEMKPGERPDTVHIRGLPRQWFVHIEDVTQSKLSEYVVNAVFERFGEVRIIDIPSLDPYRSRMPMSISGVSKFSHNDDLLFDVYIQYKEYIGFAKCMQALQYKKLVYKSHEHAFSANLQVDFDKTKHLSEYAIRQREIEREKLMAAEVQQGQKVRKIKEMEDMKKEFEKISEDEKERQKNEEKENKRKVKEDKRKQKELKKRLRKILRQNKSISVDNMEEILTDTIALDERKLIIAQRKLECVRLFDKISERIKISSAQSKEDYSSLGSWYNFECQALYKSKKGTLKKYKKYKTDENFVKYTMAARKLRRTVQKQKDKYAMECAQENMKLGIIEDEILKKKEMTARRKLIKAMKLKHVEQQQAQKKRVDKLLRGKVRVREDLDDVGKKAVIVSPATSGAESDSSSSFTDFSSSDNEDKKNKSLKEDDLNSEAFQKFLQHQRYGNFNPQFQNNFGSYRGRGRFWRPYHNRGFRGGFQERGRGFNSRGRYLPRGRGNNFEYFKLFEHPIQRGQEKWFRRGGDDDEAGDYPQDDKYSRSRSRSYDSRRSYSRSSSRRRSSSRSRSKERRSRSRSWSKESRRRSSERKDRSRSVSKRRASVSDGHRSRSRSSEFKRRHRSRDNRSWSKSSRSSRHSQDRHRKSSKHSLSRSRSRSHSRSRRQRYESDVPSDIDYIDESPYHEFGKSHHYDGPKPYYEYRGRGNWRNKRGFRGPRRGRSWRGRGYRGNSNFYHQENDAIDKIEYHNMYQRYFDSVAEKENKRHEDDYSDDEHRSRDRRTSGHKKYRKDDSSPEKRRKSRNDSEDRSPDAGRLYSDKSSSKSIKDRLSSRSHKKQKKSAKEDSDIEMIEDTRKPRSSAHTPVDMDVRYREEEERFRSEIVAKHSKRHIRGRMPESDDDGPRTSRSSRRVQYQSDSDEEAYGPKPPPRRRR